MSDVYTFINDGLSNFSDIGIYDKKLRNNCYKLNELLNKVTIQDYDEHIRKYINDINNEIKILNISIHEELFVDLSRIVELLYSFQRDNHICERDHYFHSIQCFLLAIVLLNEFWPPHMNIPRDIVAILYSLTMYHDIGYLYRSTRLQGDKINEELANFFSCSNIFYQNDIENALCLRIEPYSSELNAIIIEAMKNSQDIRNIWLSDTMAEKLISNDIGAVMTSAKYKGSHAYKSALILAKILFSKNITKANCETVLNKKLYDENNWFRQILGAIYLHDFDTLSSPLNINNDFYPAYLIIIDELQTYGRQLSLDTHHQLINPKDVGFHWDTTIDKKKLVIDIVTTNKKLMRDCNAHNIRKIKSILCKKIKRSSLSKMIKF